MIQDQRNEELWSFDFSSLFYTQHLIREKNIATDGAKAAKVRRKS